MEIKDKVAIVTGASQGIGLAVSQALAREGAKVVLAARSADTIKAEAAKLPDALAVTADMRNLEDIRRMVAETLEKYGRIDILINNAGQGMYGPLEFIDLEKYKNIMELNVYGTLQAMQAVIPEMRKQGGGLILNVSSRVSKNHFPNLSAYASTKYALNALSLTARDELAKDHIAVCLMHPKMTSTNFGRNSITANPLAAREPKDLPDMQVDTGEQVAERMLALIRSEDPEAEM